MVLPVPVEATRSVGDILTASEWNTAVRDAVNFLTGPPLFVGYQTTIQSVASGTYTPVNIDTSVVDTYSGHSNVTNNSRYTSQLAGYYLVIGQVAIAPNATGNRAPTLAIGGVAVTIGSQQLPNSGAGTNSVIQVSGIWQLGAGAYIEVWAYQGSGGSLNTVTTLSSLQAYWLHS